MGTFDDGQFVGQHLGFFGGAVVREVAAQQQRVGGFGSLREEGAQGAGGILGDVDVADDGEAHVGGGLEHEAVRLGESSHADAWRSGRL